MTSFAPLAYSIGMIAAFLLIGSGLFMGLSRKDWKRGGLMLAVALVLIVNVLIWTLPGSAGQP